MSQADQNPLEITEALIAKFGIGGYSQILVFGLEAYNRRVAEIQHSLYDADGEFAAIVSGRLSTEANVHSFALETDGTTLVLTIVGTPDDALVDVLRVNFAMILQRLPGLSQACPEIRLDILIRSSPPA